MNNRLFGMASIIFAAGYFVRSFDVANASMPVGMQHGQFPYEQYTECDLTGAVPQVYSAGVTEACRYGTSGQWTNHTLFTVPSDRNFIITGFSTESGSCFPFSNGEALIGRSIVSTSDSTPFNSGTAHFVLSPNQVVEIAKWSDSDCAFYLEGYYAHP